MQQPFVCFLLFFCFQSQQREEKTYQRTNEWMRMSSTVKCIFFILSNFVFFLKRQLEMTASNKTSQNSSFGGKQYTVRHFFFLFFFFFLESLTKLIWLSSRLLGLMFPPQHRSTYVKRPFASRKIERSGRSNSLSVYLSVCLSVLHNIIIGRQNGFLSVLVYRQCLITLKKKTNKL